MFTTGDPEHTGKINPQTATRIFSASSLSPDALARIWEIASVDSKDGLLDRQGVGVALRLIGHAQKGEVVNESLVKQRESFVGLNLPRTKIAQRVRLPCLRTSPPSLLNLSQGRPVGYRLDRSPL